MPKSTETKSFTLRLPALLADELATVAEVDSVPVQQAVREAIAEHIEARRRVLALVEFVERNGRQWGASADDPLRAGSGPASRRAQAR